MTIHVQHKKKPAGEPAMINCFMGIKYKISDTTKLLSTFMPTASNNLLQK